MSPDAAVPEHWMHAAAYKQLMDDEHGKVAGQGAKEVRSNVPFCAVMYRTIKKSPRGNSEPVSLLQREPLAAFCLVLVKREHPNLVKNKVPRRH